jgi:peptidoglycan/LPS O-acetylase OafA/YrhL
MGCSMSAAKKRYERRMLMLMCVYSLILLDSAWSLKHHGNEKSYLYFWSLIPALPIFGFMLTVVHYLREETDEYQRVLATRSILVGTALLLCVLAVSDFLRVFAPSALPGTFMSFMIFYMGMAIAQMVQNLRSLKVGDENTPA